jgi:quinoprotein glucose dehydrogenase
VDGRFRGEIKRDSVGVKNQSADALIKLTSHKDQSIRLAAVKATGKLRIDKASDALFARLKGDNQAEVRSEALKAMARMNSTKINDAIKVALADKDKSVRVTGLDLLEKLNISKELMVTLLAEVIKTKTPEERQAALVTLGKLPVQNTRPVLEQLLTTYASGKLPAEVNLELADAIDSTKSAPLIARYKEITSKLSPDDTLKAAYAGALLGGDADRGRRIFFSHQTAQCLRCHSYDDMGGTAGPRLNGVAKRLTRQQLLEALVNPSARLAPGFGNVTLELKNGKKVNGILQGEKDQDLSVKVGDKPDTLIRKDQITKRTNAASSMPPMPYLLTKKEIRDVVSFLATLQGEE